MKDHRNTQSKLLREYAKAYLDGRVPEEYTNDSLVTYTGRFRGKTVDIPLPKYDDLQAAVAAAARRD